MHKKITLFSLQYEQVTPVSFVTSDAHLKLSGYKQQIMNCSFDFRTFNEGGMLLYNKFSQEGFVKVNLFTILISNIFSVNL